MTAPIAVATLAAGVATGLVVAAGPATATQTFALPSSGNIKIIGHGFGHGHGMSQYGAQGAAQAGLSSTQIIAFYYQHTTLSTVGPTTMRVLISGGLDATTVAPQSGLTLRSASGAVLGPNPLPVSGISRLRLVANGSGLQLQSLSGSTWSAVPHARDLPPQADFRSVSNKVRLYRADGTSTVYRGTIGAVRSGAGELTINRVALDDYTAGVVPREMPASWNPAAVHAQALAARTFGLYEKQHSSGAYDVCDNQNCQVYGGYAHYDSNNNLLWSEDQAALTGNQNTVITYGGAPILAQFSASDGGWTTDGGLPYLAARADPYDTEAGGDPYADWTQSVPVSQLASAYGLATATTLQITQRDGNGDWGGRVLNAVVTGTTSSGQATSVPTTGFGLQDALGLMQNWFTVDAGMATAPQSVTAVPGDAGATVSWAAPASTGGHTITGYLITAGSVTMTVPASARSAYVGPLTNAASSTITVQAINKAGAGQSGAVAVRPAAALRGVQALAPLRLFDTRTTGARVTPGHPYTFSPAGHGSIPATGARSVQLALTILSPSTSGRLQVVTAGVNAPSTQAITYIAGRTTTVTVSVPLVPGGSIRFVPSAGSLDLLGDQTSFTVTRGAAISPVAPATALTTTGLSTTGSTVPLASVPGVSSKVYAVVVRVTGSTTGTTPGWVQVWQSTGATPNARALSVTPGITTSNLVTVPIGAARALAIRGSSTAVHASLTVVGVVGSAASGLFEALPPTPTRDSAAGSAAVAGSATVSSHTAVLALTGTRQLPGSGVAAVLLHVSVIRPGAGGALWLWQAGLPRPTAPAVYFGAGHTVTTTVLVPVSSLGHVQWRTSGPTVSVALDSVGYVTT